MSIQPLGQAGLLLRAAGSAVLIDPWLSDWLETPSAGNPQPVVRDTPPRLRIADLPPVGVVCYTHEHPDHLDPGAVPELAAAFPAAAFVVPAPLVDAVVALGVGRDRVRGVLVEQPLRIGAVEITALPAPHAFAPGSFGGYTWWTDEAGRHRAVGYLVRLGGVTLFHGGDTVRRPGDAERLRRAGVDVAALPVNGRDESRERRGLVGNLHPGEAVDLAAEAGIPRLVPIHYDGVVGNTGGPAAAVAHVLAHRLPVSVHLLAGPGELLVVPGAG